MKKALLRSAPLVACSCLLLIASAGCKSNKQAPGPARHQEQHPASPILSVQVSPGSAFKMSLAMEPAQPKFGSKTNFRVTINDSSGAPVTGAQAKISLVMPLMDMGKNEFSLKPADRGGEYQGTGQFTMAGEWEVVISATAPGKTGKYTFNVNVAE